MIQDVIQKIRKLLALAQSTNPHEAAVAAAAADRLIQQHRLDQATIEAEGGDADGPIEDPEPVLSYRKHATAWKRTLLFCMTKHYDVARYRACSPRGGYEYRLIGRPDDLRATKEMFALVSAEIMALAPKSGARGRSALNAFKFGCVCGIWERMVDAKKATVAGASESVAIVLANRADQALYRMHQLHSDLRNVVPYTPQISDDQAFRRGVVAGKTIDLHQKGKRLGSPL